MAAPRGNERVPGRYSARRTKRQYPRAHWCVWTPRLRNDNASRHSHPGIHPRCRWHRSGRNEAYLNNERSNTMPSTADRVRSVLQGIEERDSDLARELRSVRERTTTLEMPANVEIAEDAGFTQDLTQETIVLRAGRPVLAVSHNEPRLVFGDAESEVWRERLNSAHNLLIPAIRAVGRIELENNPRFDWVGTGWLVSEDIIVTNRHVASEFGTNEGSRFIFRTSPMGKMAANIDFLREVDNSDSYGFEVSEILHIEPGNGPDVAFLRLRTRTSSSLAEPIRLSAKVPSRTDFVAVIGYPARDSRIPEQDLMDRIFGNIYNRKRLAPGQVMSWAADSLRHDCSTLGGNSGSVVLSIATGEAVALHFSGRFLESNYAVPAALVADRLHRISHVGKSVPAPPTSGASLRVPAVEQAAASELGGQVSFEIPLTFRLDIGVPRRLSSLARPSLGMTNTHDEGEIDNDELMVEGRVEDYSDREGYKDDFMGSKHRVPLPTISAHDVVTFESNGMISDVLNYQHFSTAMSRGHMTRREDPIWGSVTEAAKGNADSMHVTNVVPQMQPFNAPIWLGLEDYALEHAREDEMLISVFTGPFFAKNDPIMYGVKIPVSFWKIIAFVHDNTKQLCATGYTMSQHSFLREEEFVFGQHETSQIPISTIEARSALKFGDLSLVDPLRGGEESLTLPLTDYSQIKFY